MENKAHEKDARFQARRSLSAIIEGVTSEFEKQLETYQLMRFELDMKFNQVAASSNNAKRTDLMEIAKLLVETTNAINNVVAALKTLARLAHCLRAWGWKHSKRSGYRTEESDADASDDSSADRRRDLTIGERTGTRRNRRSGRSGYRSAHVPIRALGGDRVQIDEIWWICAEYPTARDERIINLDLAVVFGNSLQRLSDHPDPVSITLDNFPSLKFCQQRSAKSNWDAVVGGQDTHALTAAIRNLIEELMRKSSKKQIASNRANAAKSTGPKSADGKKKSRQNALKNGFFSTDVVAKAAGERAEDFQKFKEWVWD
jgi:hypothetical protein